MTGSLYLPGQTWLHRVWVGPKLAVLLVSGACLMYLHAPSWLFVCFVLVCVLLRQTGASFLRVRQQMQALLWLLLTLGGLSAWSQGFVQALEMVLRVATLVLGALVVSLTTPLTEMMRVVEFLLTPLQRLGWVKADRVALAIGLTLRLIPELSVQWHEIREAQLARGLRLNPLTLAVPMLIRVLRRAEEIAEALDARG